MQDFLRIAIVLLPTLGWGAYVYWAIKSAKAKNELDSIGKTFKIMGVALAAALLFGVVFWKAADFVTSRSEENSQNSSTVNKVEEFGGLIPELGVSERMTMDGQSVEIDQDAAPARVQDGDEAVEIVPPVVPTRVPLPQRTFDPKNPPVTRWASWFKGNHLHNLSAKDKYLLTTKVFPLGMICSLTNVESTAFAGVESEKWQLQDCQVPNKPDWGKATINVNGVVAEALGLHKSGKVHTIRGSGEWPEGTFRQVKPTDTTSPSSSPAGQDMGGSNVPAPVQGLTDTSRYWSRFELLANQTCRAGTSDTAPELTTVAKGTIVMGDPYTLANPSTDPRMEILVPGKGTCWIKIGDGNAVQR